MKEHFIRLLKEDLVGYRLFLWRWRIPIYSYFFGCFIKAVIDYRNNEIEVVGLVVTLVLITMGCLLPSAYGMKEDSK